jgi:O-succinylbenzoic acid--CoA ligase
MVYISKDGEVIRTESGPNQVLELYDAWNNGAKQITLYTSGSTGTPKEIVLTREAIEASAGMTTKAFHLDAEDLFVCNLNTDYIGGKMMIIRAALLGAEILAVPPNRNPFEELEAQAYILHQNRGKNFLSFVPMQLQAILEVPMHIELLKTAKAILSGGAPVPLELKKKIKELDLPVFETYGMTETISHIAIKDLRTNHEHFTALEGVHLSTDERNCLQISAPSTLGETITTNDVVELTSPITFVLKGRADLTINSGGVKIQAEVVERMIAEAYPSIGTFFCFGLPDKTLGQRLVMVVEGPAPNIDWEQIPLPKYHKPKEIISIPEFIRTASGKIDKLKTLHL